MDGKIHHYWSIYFSTVILTLLTYMFTKQLYFLFGSIILHILNGIFHAIERSTEFKIEDIMNEMKKNHHNLNLKNEMDKWNKKNIIWRKISWSCIYITAVIIALFSDYINNMPRITSVILSVLSILMSASGAYFPDIDFNWGIDEHRNPFTHSYIIPLCIMMLSMIGIMNQFRYMILLPAMFCMGYVSHLFLDCIPKSTRNFSSMIKELFINWKNSPGDIRYIPERWEHSWLFISGIIIIVIFGFSIPKFYGTHGFDQDIILDQNGNISWDLYIYFPPYIIISMIILFIGIFVLILVFYQAYYIVLKKKLDKILKKKM